MKKAAVICTAIVALAISFTGGILVGKQANFHAQQQTAAIIPETQQANTVSLHSIVQTTPAFKHTTPSHTQQPLIDCVSQAGNAISTIQGGIGELYNADTYLTTFIQMVNEANTNLEAVANSHAQVYINYDLQRFTTDINNDHAILGDMVNNFYYTINDIRALEAGDQSMADILRGGC